MTQVKIKCRTERMKFRRKDLVLQKKKERILVLYFIKPLVSKLLR